MKLKELTDKQKIKLLAELDGWTFHPSHDDAATGNAMPDYWSKPDDTQVDICWKDFPTNYLTSYDAIIPLLQKLDPPQRFAVSHYLMSQIKPYAESIGDYYYQSPSQLCDAVLIATGKAEE